MLSRTILIALAVIGLALFLLVNYASPSEARTHHLPITPPPVAPQPARVVPLRPTATATSTVAVTSTATVTPTTTVTPTPTLSATTTLSSVLIITATGTNSFLPTVTPTPADPLLLPTPTPSPTRVVEPTRTADFPQVIAPSATATSTLTVTPTLTSTLTLTTTSAVTVSVSPTVTSAITQDSEILPPLLVTNSVPLPLSYEAKGSFGSQTVYTDSTIVQQQGRFTIVQAAAPNAYGANQRYTLSTQRAVGVVDEINVFQIDDYIAVNYTGGDWMLARRDQGSNIVRAIQPISDLAILFPRIISQAEFVGQETIDGIFTLRYRIDDPTGQGARLIQPLLALTGEIRSLKLEVWIAVPGGFVVGYNFQVELAGARVLDEEGNEVRADQAVSWTYQLTPTDEPTPVTWPEDAPTPDAFPVPGFALGEFPIPENTELLTLVQGLPELLSTLSPTEVDSFYRTELFDLGWVVEGEDGLLSASSEGTTIQILITEDSAIDGTRITVLPAD